MRASHLIGRARYYGNHAYEMARHVGGTLNNVIETSARAYGGIIKPLLLERGVDTRGADSALMGMYRDWDTVRTSANKFDSLIKA